MAVAVAVAVASETCRRTAMRQVVGLVVVQMSPSLAPVGTLGHLAGGAKSTRAAACACPPRMVAGSWDRSPAPSHPEVVCYLEIQP